jgi:hypothetical protein
MARVTDNVVPGAYRGVAVADVDFPPTAAAIEGHFLGRECYRRTRFIVVRHGDEAALIRVESADRSPLFSAITSVEVLAAPEETRLLVRPDIDTGVPSQLARVAAEPAAVGARCVIVHGRYGHVSFLLDPRPIRIRVQDVVPPRPAKLLEQAERVVEMAEDMPPTVLVPDLVDLDDLVPPDGDVLLPCRGGDTGGGTDGERRLWFLDERPDHRPWTLVGCTRSAQIHEWFYGGPPAAAVDICPRRRPRSATDGAVLTKCCLYEDEISVEPGLAVVPWGATLADVRRALAALTQKAEPTWAPA